MAKKYTIIIEKDAHGWLVSEVVELPGCHTQAKTFDELIKRTKEAIILWLKEQDYSETETSFVGIQKIEV